MRPPRVMDSPFMQFAKSNSGVACHLGASGVTNFLLRQLPVTLEDLEITGDSTYGYPPLQKALASFCGAPEECVVASVGTSLANHLAIAATIEPGDEVLVEAPTYELILSTAGYLGARIKSFPRRAENGFRIDPSDVRRAAGRSTRLIIITNLHNPSSVLTDDATLREIGAIAENSGAKVLVDEVYLDAAYDLHPGSAFRLGPTFIVTSSLTKVYGLSGLRCGWILADPDLARRIWHLNDLFGSIPAHPAERLSVVALRNIGMIRDWSRELVGRNRKFLDQFLSSRADLETVNPGIGTVVFPKLKSGSVDRLYTYLMEKYSTSVAPGRFFGLAGHFRIGIGLTSDLVEKGLQNLGSALETFRQ